MSAPKLSIVIPTYNRCQGLPRTIEAVLNQSYTDFELIVVNDGSTDDTEHVLRRLCEKDSRVRAVNKKNGGVSSTRNAGLDAAKGEYVVFMDDDDLLARNHVAALMADDSDDFDLIIDSYSRQVDENEPSPVEYPVEAFDDSMAALDYIFGALQAYPYCFFVYAKRYRRRILERYAIRFDTSMSIGEDRPFILNYLRHCDKVKIMNSHSYIVKADSAATYRLSNGNKPAEYLWHNFTESYGYLRRYSRETGIPKIGRYADNFLAEKVFEYLLVPKARGGYDDRKSVELISVDVRKRLREIRIGNIRNFKIKVITILFRSLGLRAAERLLRAVL